MMLYYLVIEQADGSNLAVACAAKDNDEAKQKFIAWAERTCGEAEWLKDKLATAKMTKTDQTVEFKIWE